jgi:hypothetical protein
MSSVQPIGMSGDRSDKELGDAPSQGLKTAKTCRAEDIRRAQSSRLAEAEGTKGAKKNLTQSRLPPL